MSPPPANGREMIHPYTLTAQFKKFPWKFYWKHNFVFRNTIIAYILLTPVFWKITKLVNSPENVAKWDEIHAKEKHHSEHKFDLK